MLLFRLLLLVLLSPVLLAAPQGQTQTPSVEPNLTEEEMRQFLLTADVVKSKTTKKGVTRPYVLTLRSKDGSLTHDAGFQSVDIDKPFEKFDDGTTEISFRDTYHFNIAAYEIAKLLGLERMMPVTVERKWSGKTGSLTWWLNTQMDERERIEKKIHPPDVEAWNRQMYRKRIFAMLVYDKDINLTNVMIGPNWELYMIDFTRAFRKHEKLPNPKELARGDRQLLEKLRLLTREDVKRVTGSHLMDGEIKALMIRRDLILKHFEQLVKEKGEAEVLY